MAILGLEGIRKSFGGNRVLDGVDMEVGRGSICQLIGSNGSGKTTLINCVSGLYVPDSGRVVFDGTDVTRLGLRGTFRAGLVRTWQIPRPFAVLTALENMLVAGGPNRGESFLRAPLRGWVPDEEALVGRALSLASDVGLEGKGGERGSELSGGQKKLLELGRAMMSGARMVLMDEPIAGVNPTLAHEIFERIERIRREHGITFLIVEHRLDISFQYVDRVFAMDGGRIIAEGTPDEVSAHPGVIESYLGGAP
ncbi:MAG: ABC transporter ATP-binding protein [Nitrosopumilus sp.]|nr:ABC transporter ATP-binding protein [Nitrosopumilus sp.]MDA7953252.1 ABC transporter ATP-binding protein [Nitrosopumilus sp.]MDA7959724.1 ABC transporter ATP-binding protein [Nitrosopumilus sp.]MDA7999031.1 ABC transporter ATP-binding protein [Nitrosopumilus sp.]